MKRKINFKKTWWIFLLMFLLVLMFAIPSVCIDYVLNHSEYFTELVNETFVGSYTNYDILLIIHISYIVCLVVLLGGCLLNILFNLLVKFNRE